MYSICTFIDVQRKKRKIRSESGKENALRTRNQLNKKMACFVNEYFGMPPCEISQKEARINDEDILKMINRPIPRQSNKDMQSMIDEHCPPILVDDMKSNGCFLLCV